MPLGEAIESAYLKWNLEQHILKPKYDIMRSLMPLVKHYFVTTEDDGTTFKITCQCCNDFVTHKVKIGELLYITFFHYGLSTFVLYPADNNPKNVYFQ